MLFCVLETDACPSPGLSEFLSPLLEDLVSASGYDPPQAGFGMRCEGEVGIIC